MLLPSTPEASMQAFSSAQSCPHGGGISCCVTHRLPPLLWAASSASGHLLLPLSASMRNVVGFLHFLGCPGPDTPQEPLRLVLKPLGFLFFPEVTELSCSGQAGGYGHHHTVNTQSRPRTRGLTATVAPRSRKGRPGQFSQSSQLLLF